MALSSQRNTRQKATPALMIVPVAASTKIYLGSLVGVNAAGYAVPATSALIVLGRAERVANGIPAADADNTSGADGAISIEVRRGCFSWAINSGDITQANVGQVAYAVDDQTVSSSSAGGARPIAGRIVGLDQAGGVYVDSTETFAGIPAGSIETLAGAGVAAPGAATVAGSKVGQKVLAVFGSLTAGGVFVNKVPGTDFEAVVSVADQVQQLTATDLHLYTFIFVLGTK